MELNTGFGKAARDHFQRGLSLKELTERFGSPLTEEQAWAVCHQCCTMLQQLRWPCMPPDTSTCTCEISMEGLMVTLGGKIELQKKRTRSSSHKQYRDYKEVLFDVGILVYTLLDFGLAENEERDLSPPLESLIEWLTGEECCSDSDSLPGLLDVESVCSSRESVATRDSGIIEYSHCPSGVWEQDLAHIIKACEYHVLELSDPATHYTAVCRSMVEEGSAIINVSLEEECVVRLDKEDQTRCWTGVMEDIKRGVVLKNVPPDCAQKPSKVELSKYDCLLMEISKFDKTTMNKVLKITRSPTSHRKSSPPRELKFHHSIEIPQRTRSTWNRTRRATVGNIHSSLMLELKTRPALKPASQRPLRPVSPVSCPLSPMESLMEEIQMPHTLRRVERCSPRRHASEGNLHVCKSQSEIEDISPPAVFPLAPFPSSTSPYIHFSVTTPNEDQKSKPSVPAIDIKQCSGCMIEEETVSQVSLFNTCDSDTASDVFVSESFLMANTGSNEKTELTFSEVIAICEVAAKAKLFNLQFENTKLCQEVKREVRCFDCLQTRFTIFNRSQACYICKWHTCSKCTVKYVPTNRQAGPNGFTHKSSYTMCSSCWEFVQSNSSLRILEESS